MFTYSTLMFFITLAVIWAWPPSIYESNRGRDRRAKFIWTLILMAASLTFREMPLLEAVRSSGWRWGTCDFAHTHVLTPEDQLKFKWCSAYQR